MITQDLATILVHTTTVITVKQVIASISLNGVTQFGGIAHCGKEQRMSEKIYRVQMNSKGMPNFSTAEEVDAVCEWIPCSERLPEEGIRVITFDTDGDINIMYFDGCETEDGYIWKDDLYIEWCDIIAWMPLPKPYGERKGE